MNRIEEIKRDLPGLRKHFGTDYGWPKDIEYLLRIAEAARLPANHDIDSLVWCQRFINKLQETVGDDDE